MVCSCHLFLAIVVHNLLYAYKDKHFLSETSCETVDGVSEVQFVL